RASAQITGRARLTRWQRHIACAEGKCGAGGEYEGTRFGVGRLSAREIGLRRDDLDVRGDTPAVRLERRGIRAIGGTQQRSSGLTLAKSDFAVVVGLDDFADGAIAREAELLFGHAALGLRELQTVVTKPGVEKRQ